MNDDISTVIVPANCKRWPDLQQNISGTNFVECTIKGDPLIPRPSLKSVSHSLIIAPNQLGAQGEEENKNRKFGTGN